jgi:lysophospholipase L1-like esterase
MKSLFILAVISFFSESSFAQSKWDSTYRPGTYEHQLAHFKSFPNSKKEVVFLGDSIFDYIDWNELLQMKYARNRGISGDISFGLLQRLEEITEGKPAKIFIMIGINDIARNIPDAVILQNYKKIIYRVKTESPRTKLYFFTLMPVNNTFPTKAHFNKDEHIANINKQLQLLGDREGITIINMHDPFLDSENRYDKKYTYDGLHPNIEGYKKMAEVLKCYL